MKNSASEKRKTGFPPIHFPDSQILILGTFPSVKSLEQQEYYAHKQNQFWKIIAALQNIEVPTDYPGKIALLKTQKIALWDVFESCINPGSADSSIKDPKFNDLPTLFKTDSIKKILANGQKAHQILLKCQNQHPEIAHIPTAILPSTSPANARYPLTEKIRQWHEHLKL